MRDILAGAIIGGTLMFSVLGFTANADNSDSYGNFNDSAYVESGRVQLAPGFVGK